MNIVTAGSNTGYWSGRGGDACARFGFLLVPDFTLIGLGAAVDPLRLANMVARRKLYECITLTMDGEPVRPAAGGSDGRILPAGPLIRRFS